MATKSYSLKLWVTIIVSVLGYMVDAYDMYLFALLRTASLADLGLDGDQMVSTGALLLNLQLAGMLLGGVLWGVMGDKLGRMSVLFGSILLYSLATIANGFVDSILSYAILRFIAGIGLAGEVGAAITLVTEISNKKIRGYTGVLVASAGAAGALLASLTATMFDWRTMYMVGGGAGLALLLLRFSLMESGLYNTLKENAIPRGSLRLLFSCPKRTQRYLMALLPVAPAWFIIGVMLTFSPELAKSLGIIEPVTVAKATTYFSCALLAGEFAAGALMQWFKTSRRVMMAMALAAAGFCFLLVILPNLTPALFYGLLSAAGFAMGYWAIFMISTAEQFGTNLRATVVTTVPNFVRALGIPCTLAFSSLKPWLGVSGAVQAVGAVVFALALWGIYTRPETFGRDMNFIEEESSL